MDQGVLTLEQIERSHIGSDCTADYRYPFDSSGKEPTNRVHEELVRVDSSNRFGNIVILREGYFYTEDIIIKDLRTGNILTKATRDDGEMELSSVAAQADYYCSHIEPTVASITGKEAAFTINFIGNMPGDLLITYQVVGGVYTTAYTASVQALANANDKEICFLDIRDRPLLFRPHEHSIDMTATTHWENVISTIENMDRITQEQHLYSYGMLRKYACKQASERMKPVLLGSKSNTSNHKPKTIDGFPSSEKMTKSDLLALLDDYNAKTVGIYEEVYHVKPLTYNAARTQFTLRVRPLKSLNSQAPDLTALVRMKTDKPGYAYNIAVSLIYNTTTNEYVGTGNNDTTHASAVPSSTINDSGTLMPTPYETVSKGEDIISVELMHDDNVERIANVNVI